MGGVNILLVVFLTTFAFGVFKGYRKGFVGLIVYLISLVMVILIATKISPYVSNYVIENTNAYENVREKVIDFYLNKTEETVSLDEENQPGGISEIGLPEIVASAIISNNTEDMYSKLAAALFEEYIAGYLAKMAIRAASFVGLFIVFTILSFCIIAAMRIMERIRVVRTINRLLGMVTGGGIVILIHWVFSIAIMMFFYDSLGSWMMKQVQSSVILSFLFNNNLLFNVLLG